MVLYSANDLALQVANELQNHGEKVRFIETSPRLAEKGRQAGFEVIFAETIGDCLDIVASERVQALLTLSVHDDRNLMVCKAANCAGFDNIVALVNDPQRIPDYQSLGVEPFNLSMLQPPLLAALARSPDIIRLMTTTSDDQDLREITLMNPELDGRRVRTLGLPGNLLVLSISRNGEMIIPHGNTRLQTYDRLTILGNNQELKDASLILG